LTDRVKFGTITFRKLASNFSKINIGSKYTDVTLYVDPDNVGFNVEINNRKSRIMYPRIYNLKEELVNPKENAYTTTGHVGKSSNSKVFIDASYGTINLKMR